MIASPVPVADTDLQSTTDAAYIALALEEAEKALAKDEVPVGAILVWEGKGVVARSHNTRESGKNALGHAEISAIDEACKTLGGWRLHKATLYVTLEPCLMCTGAILSARIKRVVYGAPDTKAGGLGGLCDLREVGFPHTPEVVSGVEAEKCRGLLDEFFVRLRERKKK
ncbi:MAG: nucleoside deaminase [Clostridia bacterium]|nr:nucleoside deaminase [Clostridia bacterium]